jgi:hypothetical protein
VKVDQRALAGIDVKIKRAEEHFGVLHDEMLAWHTDQPYRLVQEMHDHGCKHLWRLKLDRPLPVEWAIIMGEAVHDLRSALEQCVYWLTIDHGRRPLPGTGFPVSSRRSDFERHTRGGGLYQIRGIGAGPQAFIEKLQPYPQRWRYAPGVAIRTLHDLWNKDKHRLVNIWGLHFNEHTLRPVDSPRPPIDCTTWIDRRVLQENAIPLRVLCATPHPNVKMDGDAIVNISMRVGRSALRAGGQSAWIMTGYTADVIYKLLGAFGRQDAPINSSIWSARPAYPPR